MTVNKVLLQYKTQNKNTKIVSVPGCGMTILSRSRAFFVHALDNFRKIDIMKKIPAVRHMIKSQKALQKPEGTKNVIKTHEIRREFACRKHS